jgi:uncharacterized protein YeaO (DUF488 family)
MPGIVTKSVWSPMHGAADGLRILATRYIPRGCPAQRYDVWMANLGPSEQLLKSFKAEETPWKVFARRYQKEIFSDSAVDAHNPRIKNHGQKFTLRLLKELAKRQTITLLCHCAEDEPHCHRHLLKAILESANV